MKKQETNQLKEQFEEILLEAIDEGFSSLGERAKASVYSYLERNFNIEKNDIPNRISDFSLALHGVFGLGAKQLEILFMRNIHKRLDSLGVGNTPKKLNFDLTFKDYVEVMRLSYENEIETIHIEALDAEQEQPQRL